MSAIKRPRKHGMTWLLESKKAVEITTGHKLDGFHPAKLLHDGVIRDVNVRHKNKPTGKVALTLSETTR